MAGPLWSTVRRVEVGGVVSETASDSREKQFGPLTIVFRRKLDFVPNIQFCFYDAIKFTYCGLRIPFSINTVQLYFHEIL